MRDDRIRAQRDEQNKQEKESKVEDDFQTVTSKRGAKEKKSQANHRQNREGDQNKLQQIDEVKQDTRRNMVSL